MSLGKATAGPGVLVLIHLVGLAGLGFSATRPLFISLTPLSLLVSLAMLLWERSLWQGRVLSASVIIYLAGYLVELAGTKSRMIFGDYWYGAGLGTLLLGVPLIIGVNWLLLTISAYTIVRPLKIPVALRLILGALLMTGLDWIIEPVAVKLDYWQWANDSIPLRNYLAWFVFSFLLQCVWHRAGVQPERTTAVVFFIIQIFFFTALRFML
ncbi:MAG: carotenoid biosynthesis protein [Sphingobacteriales bacterium]|nr:MAG: carotenoid biosynthesis protein [Sphingobacteriales bacterium]